MNYLSSSPLSAFPVGTVVRIWCIGTSRWDSPTEIVASNSFYVEVKYSDGATLKFVPDARAIRFTPQPA